MGKILVIIFLLGAQTDLETMSEVRLCQSNPFTWEKLHYEITCECFFLTNRKHLMLACRLQMIILRNLVEMMCQESIYWSHYSLSESLLQGDHSGMLGALENFNFYVKYKAICRTQGSGMTEWLGCWTAGLAIQRPRVQVPCWPLAGFVHRSTEFKSSTTLVNSQLACLLPVGILNPV